MRVARHIVTADLCDDIADSAAEDAVPIAHVVDRIGIWALYSDGVSILLSHHPDLTPSAPAQPNART